MKKQKESKKTKMKKYSLIFVSVIIALMIMISWYFVMISFQERESEGAFFEKDIKHLLRNRIK